MFRTTVITLFVLILLACGGLKPVGTPLLPSDEVDAHNLAKAFQEDRIMADKAYKNREFVVSGTVIQSYESDGFLVVRLQPYISVTGKQQGRVPTVGSRVRLRAKLTVIGSESLLLTHGTLLD